MQQKLTPEIIIAAIAGFEAQRIHLDSQIAELRSMLTGEKSTESVANSIWDRQAQAQVQRRLSPQDGRCPTGQIRQTEASIRADARVDRQTKAENERRWQESNFRRNQKALGGVQSCKESGVDMAGWKERVERA
jgi:hypothetical protein